MLVVGCTGTLSGRLRGLDLGREGNAQAQGEKERGNSHCGFGSAGRQGPHINMHRTAGIRDFIIYVLLHPLLVERLQAMGFDVNSPSASENSSVGRAQPCQGWGREFESRFSLKVKGFRKEALLHFGSFIGPLQCPGCGPQCGEQRHFASSPSGWRWPLFLSGRRPSRAPSRSAGDRPSRRECGTHAGRLRLRGRRFPGTLRWPARQRLAIQRLPAPVCCARQRPIRPRQRRGCRGGRRA